MSSVSASLTSRVRKHDCAVQAVSENLETLARPSSGREGRGRSERAPLVVGLCVNYRTPNSRFVNEAGREKLKAGTVLGRWDHVRKATEGERDLD